MLQGQKHPKLYDQARNGSQSVQVAQAMEKQEEESPSCSSPVFHKVARRSLAAGPPKTSPTAKSTSSVDVAASPKVSGKGRKSQVAKSETSSEVPRSTSISREALLVDKALMVLQYLVGQYKMQQIVRKGDMLKIVQKPNQEHFDDILKLASERLVVVFGLCLKELHPDRGTYILLPAIDLPGSGHLSNGFPKNGILLCVLGLMFLHNYRVSEARLWNFLNVLGIYDGVEHVAFGDPRKFITEDLVQERYVEYHQLPEREPPQYEFLWGPKAYTLGIRRHLINFWPRMHHMLKSYRKPQC